MISDLGLLVPRAGDALCIRSERGSTTLCIRWFYTPDLFITSCIYIRLALAISSYILTKFMDAEQRTVLIFFTQDVGCASCMCDWGIRGSTNIQ